MSLLGQDSKKWVYFLPCSLSFSLHQVGTVGRDEAVAQLHNAGERVPRALHWGHNPVTRNTCIRRLGVGEVYR